MNIYINIKIDTFDDAQPLTQSARIQCSFQIIMNEANYVLNHSLVPKGESHEHFLPCVVDLLEQNMINCKKVKTFIQLRTDGIYKNKNAAMKALKMLHDKYFDKYTGKSILKSKMTGVIYDLNQWIKDGKAEVCIYIIFI